MWTSWNSGERIVRDIEVRLLSVWGDRGQASRPSRAQLLLPDNPAIELYWVRESDHYVTDPPFAADVARAINEFIAR